LQKKGEEDFFKDDPRMTDDLKGGENQLKGTPRGTGQEETHVRWDLIP